MRITVYGSENCEPCRMVKEDLDRLSLEYEELSAEEIPHRLDKVTPTTIIQEEGGSILRVIRGWSASYFEMVRKTLAGE